jgi:hypothetical protein
MTRPLRLLLSCVAVAAAVVLGGCSQTQKQDIRTIGETEGLYVYVAGLTYQVQVSRYLNADDIEDGGYLRGLPPGEAQLSDGETWFGVFMRVDNETEEPRPTAEEFEIHTTQEEVFEPVEIDRQENAFAYEARMLEPGELLPDPDSVAGYGPIAGEMLLFKVEYEALQNRPLELHIKSPENPDEQALVDLDV